MILLTTLAVGLPLPVRADGPGRIYTQPTATDQGLLTGGVKGAVLTHAIAMERDRKRAYLATLNADRTGFRFEYLPVGRFDLVLVTTDQRVIEGLSLGPVPQLAEERAKHLELGVTKADSFFNRHASHRAGVGDGVALVFVERIRDGQILRGSGEEIQACLRRLEVIELREAGDDWQMVGTRHLFREEAPKVKGLPFLTHQHLPALGGLRVGGAPRDLGTLDLTKK
jgi:hypothetical protein